MYIFIQLISVYNYVSYIFIEKQISRYVKNYLNIFSSLKDYKYVLYIYINLACFKLFSRKHKIASKNFILFFIDFEHTGYIFSIFLTYLQQYMNKRKVLNLGNFIKFSNKK